jgi:hypothetical protein
MRSGLAAGHFLTAGGGQKRVGPASASVPHIACGRRVHGHGVFEEQKRQQRRADRSATGFHGSKLTD